MPVKKLNPELTAKYCSLIRSGMTQERAAWSCGVDEVTVWRWKQRGQIEESGKYRDFWEAYRQAEGDSLALALASINNASSEGDWRAGAWLAERICPERFGNKISVTYEEREKITDDILTRLRARLDAATFERVTRALIESVDSEIGPEQSGVLEDYDS